MTANPTGQIARLAAETAARDSYGRLLAILAARSHDIAEAEDALAEAFLAALRTWPRNGVPHSPDAWLLTAARNSLYNGIRHRQVCEASSSEIERRYQEKSEHNPLFPDERLKLLFLCAHPSIDPAIRTPLMLQAVLGLDAVSIAAAFLMQPATMGQRLVRAKNKIRDAAIPFRVPEPEQLPSRLTDVLNAIYAAYGTSWDAIPGAAEDLRGLATEAIYLARLLVTLLPDQPEPRGLLALMLYCEARSAARRDANARFIPLDRQNTALWSRNQIIEAEGLLTSASRFSQFGRFQCEAAIQSVHAQRAITGITNYSAIRTLYDLLLQHCPSLGVAVGRAAALLAAGFVQDANSAIQAIPQQRLLNYQPYWVTKAHIHQALGQAAQAQAAFATAIQITGNEATKAFLREAAARSTTDISHLSQTPAKKHIPEN